MDPFRDGRVATITEDGYIRVWELPNTGITDDMSTPVESWRAHDDKGGLLKFHRGVKDMLITTCAGRMNELRVWDMATKSILLTLTFSSTVLDMACDPSGKFVAVATREKVVTVFNMRSGEVEGSGASHEGTKGARLCWVDDEHFVSVGFGRANAREIKLFKSGSTQLQALSHTSIDTSTSQPNLFFDYDLGLLFLSAKGDTSVYVFEVDVPKRAVKQVSKFFMGGSTIVNRMWRIQPSAIEIASFTLPRQKKQYFQDDVYPPTRVVVDLKPEGMIALSMAPESPSAVRKAPIKAAVIAVDGDQGHSIMSKIREQQQDSDDDELPQDKQQGVQDSEWDD
ncbi:hypothetical protein BC829DRAFT_448424 [Chytridium lagenaria]|nr:hypothetical protein BC829DRAFT_448424 [Chytridium lagenaria]